MCGSYSSSKTTLLGLNVIYFVLSLIMIGIAVNAKVSGLVTSLPIIGGITASGVFLLFLAVIGIIGLMKNHQVMLYVYMIILFFIFIIQFSCSCAALSLTNLDQIKIVRAAWDQAKQFDISVIIEAERQLDCCGLGLNVTHAIVRIPDTEDHEWSTNNQVFTGEWVANECAKPPIFDAISSCQTCIVKILPKVQSGLNAAGGIGLFFSFTELFGAILTYRHRNLMDTFGAGGKGLNI